MNLEITVREMPCRNGSNEIYGLLYTPAEAGENLPAVVLSHGYNATALDMTDMAEELARKGFAAYCYDFCGGAAASKSGGSTLDMSIMSEMSDLNSVISMLRTSGLADTERIFLYGESQGGLVSALTAAGAEHKIAGMTLLYPALCIPDNWLGVSAEDMTPYVDFMGMQLSGKFREGLPEFDIFSEIAKFSEAVLVHHGSCDSVVAAAYSEKLCSMLENCRLAIYENEGHGFSPEARRLMRMRTVGFFEGLIKTP